jgi:hypothetical protein
MYLKNGVIIAYIVNLYLIIIIIFGQHGVVDIFQERSAIKKNRIKLEEMIEVNRVNAIKSSLINADVVDLRYLDELLRIQYSTIKGDEKVIILKPNIGKSPAANKAIA